LEFIDNCSHKGKSSRVSIFLYQSLMGSEARIDSAGVSVRRERLRARISRATGGRRSWSFCGFF